MALADSTQIVQYMQQAVDVVLTGEHADSKVSACAFHPAHPEIPAAATVSARPQALVPHFAWDARIGASSQFVHAELAALLAYGGPMRGAHICVTDPFCPNCAKNLAEAGVRAIYIDHKGFQKDFIARNGDEFKTMSMLIAEKAGISVFEVNRKAGTVAPILDQHATTRPASTAIEFFDIDPDLSLESAMRTFRNRLGTREAWTLAFVKERDGSPRGLLVFEALPPGITPEDFRTRDGDTGKYRFPLDPLTRLGIVMRRMGMTLLDQRVGCGRVPSSRALVNALGMGICDLVLAGDLPDHDPLGLSALALLREKNIINVSELS